MKDRRTKLDFKDHDLLITKQEDLLVHYLKKPNTITDSIKYINTNGILAITGIIVIGYFAGNFIPLRREEQILIIGGKN